jgi:hypothetical protein
MLTLVASMLLAAVAPFGPVCTTDDPPIPTPPATPISAPTAQGDRDATGARINSFLDELEKTSTTIVTLSGGLTLEKFDSFVEETERRFGRIILDRKDGKRRFAIYFDEFVDGSGRADRAIDHWIYADGWLCEQDFRNKSFTKRQIVAPGDSFDPLAIGEGPIPLPIGQKKADVLARFNVTEVDIPLDVPVLGSMQNVTGLRLVPKADSVMAKDTVAIELFYDRTTLAPTGVVIREKNGNRTVARIASPVVNGDVKDDDRKLLEIPNPDPTVWTIDIRPWQTPDAK